MKKNWIHTYIFIFESNSACYTFTPKPALRLQLNFKCRYFGSCVTTRRHEGEAASISSKQ